MPILTETEYEALEGLEWEAAERAPMRRPSSSPSFRQRPTSTPNYVTQVQLEAALGRVDGKIKAVDINVSTVNARLASVLTSVKKEAEERKKGLDAQTKDLNQKLQMLAMLPVLITPPSKKLATPLPVTGGGTISAVSVPDTNTMDTLLPLLLVSGLGGVGGFGSGTDGSSPDNSMLLLALVLAFSNKNSG